LDRKQAAATLQHSVIDVPLGLLVFSQTARLVLLLLLLPACPAPRTPLAILPGAPDQPTVTHRRGIEPCEERRTANDRPAGPGLLGLLLGTEMIPYNPDEMDGGRWDVICWPDRHLLKTKSVTFCVYHFRWNAEEAPSNISWACLSPVYPTSSVEPSRWRRKEKRSKTKTVAIRIAKC